MTLLEQHRAPTGSGRATRGFWPMRDLPVVGWLVAVAVVSLVHPFVPAPRWLMLHLLLLGAAGHAILVWSRYFADTLLRTAPTPRGRQTARLAVFNAGVLLVTTGVPSGRWALTVAGAAGVVCAVGWHVLALLAGLRGRFGSRFAGTVRYYVAAGALLPVGAALGTWLARDPADPLATRLEVAHVAVNLLGWVGLTVLGTLVTLWPTILRTRMAEGAERAARAALPVLLAGIGLVVLGAVADQRPGVLAGLTTYLVGVLLLGRVMLRVALVRRPDSYPAWSVAAGIGWLVAMLVLLLTRVATAGPGWSEVAAVLGSVTPYLAAGFVAQVLLGALSHLVPVVLGGGPRAVSATARALDAAGAFRVTLVNLALVVCVLPVPSAVRVPSSVLVLAGLGAVVPLLLRAVARRRRGPADGTVTERPPGQRTGMAGLGVAAVVLAVAVGGAVDPRAVAGEVDATADAPPTGRTVRVTVTAHHMRFTPGRIEVRAGDRLVVTVRNTDPGDVHDLALSSGHRTPRLAPGEDAVLDVGVVGRPLDGWCSVLGHRQLGMVLAVVVRDAAGPGPDADDVAEPDGRADEPVSSAHDHDPAGSGPASPGPGVTPHDAVLPPLPPLPAGRVHRRTITVADTVREVAPGVTQRLWTYDGSAPGPTLHGRVGDRFVVRVVNRGSVGHSIDFHAGVRAPDRVMRTVPPGGELVYRFTARRAGIWMYHCSTMPMSAHIANGLFGAVVIEPPGLPEVDRSWVLVQSEQFHGPDGGPVDVEKLLAERPDAVAFNGYAGQYDHWPLRARTGERLRIWVLDAGPNRPTSFHVVGGQFDTVYAEGASLLGGPGRPDGARGSGGAQALALAPAQGGFVELTLDEPGHYPFVSHVMVDAERGAHGVLEVTR